MSGRCSGRRIGAAALVVVGVLAVPAVTGLSGVGALGGLIRPGQATNTTFTTSTKHVTSTQRVDREVAPAPECGFPGTDSLLVDESSQALDPVVSTTSVFGPATIYVGEDQQTPFVVGPGTLNIDSLTTYETVVTQYFQATAAGEACAVVATAIRFTG